MLIPPWQKPFRGMQIDKAHPLARGLVGCWIFNEATGDKIFDLSSIKVGNHNCEWVPNGIYTDGSSTKIIISDNPDIDFTTPNVDFTLVFGAYNYSSNTTYDRYIIKQDSGGDGFQFTESGSLGKQAFVVEVGGVQTYWRTNIGECFPTGEWSDIVAVYDANNVDAEIYRNGINLYKEKTVSADYGWGSTTDLWVGGRSDSANWTQAMYAYIYLYDRTLSAEEIAWLNREPYAMFQQPISPASLYYEIPVGWTGKINTATNPAKINGVAIVNITKVMGQ